MIIYREHAGIKSNTRKIIDTLKIILIKHQIFLRYITVVLQTSRNLIKLELSPTLPLKTT